MSEDSSTPEFPALEADADPKTPRKKKVATKSPAKPADEVKDQPKESVPTPETQVSEKPAESEAPTQETSPRPIKKNVRVVKKSTAKKSSAKKSPKNSQSPQDEPQTDQSQSSKSDESSQSGSESASEENTGKQQQRRGRGRNRGRQQGQNDQQQEAPKPKIDSKTVAARAWKIFAGEVNEEGLALIADKDAREMARRSLRIAEIYTREEALQLEKNKKPAKKVNPEPKAKEQLKADEPQKEPESAAVDQQD